MIILHNQEDKASRDFVAAYGAEHTVLLYPACLEHYPRVSGFPSVVIDVPDYVQPAIIDEQGISPAEFIDAHQELVRCPTTWADVEAVIAKYNQLAGI
jgi:hypothetical protein